MLAHDRLHLAADLRQQLQGLQGMQCHCLGLGGHRMCVGCKAQCLQDKDTCPLVDTVAVELL